MGLNLEPVKVSIEIETTSLAREAFYNICFITENEKAPRTLKVERLRDLLDNGYDRSSLAYNFCVGVFAQQGIPFVYVRAKRAAESYEEAFSADDNNNYYFVVIESKELYEISDFNQYLSSVDENKLQFYSNNSREITEISKGKVVNYYQEFFDFSDEEDYYLNKAYKIVTSHNYSSKPYPISIDENDGLKPNIEPVESMVLWLRVKDSLVEESAYEGHIEPKEILLKSLLRRKYVEYQEDSFQASIKPSDIEFRNTLRERHIDPEECYTLAIKPDTITLRNLLIEQWVEEEDAHRVSITPKDIKLG